MGVSGYPTIRMYPRGSKGGDDILIKPNKSLYKVCNQNHRSLFLMPAGLQAATGINLIMETGEMWPPFIIGSRWKNLLHYRSHGKVWLRINILPTTIALQEQIPSAVENITPFTFKHRFYLSFICLLDLSPQCAHFKISLVGWILHSMVWTLHTFCSTLWTGDKSFIIKGTAEVCRMSGNKPIKFQ